MKIYYLFSNVQCIKEVQTIGNMNVLELVEQPMMYPTNIRVAMLIHLIKPVR